MNPDSDKTGNSGDFVMVLDAESGIPNVCGYSLCSIQSFPVIPAKAGIQGTAVYRAYKGVFALDSCFRRNDGAFR